MCSRKCSTCTKRTYSVALALITSKSNKIDVYIILAILISFCSNKIGVYIMRQIKKLTWLQACFLGDVGVIWCNSLGESLFQIYVMNFVEIVLNYYSHITSHISQVFANCIHYTSYSLLNFVYVIVCVFGLATKFENSLSFLQNIFNV